MSNNGFHNDLIDPTTLAINFPDMTDCQGNKIFASLQPDCKGGDIDECGRTFIFKSKLKLIEKDGTRWSYKEEKKQLKIKVIGIQE